MSMPRFQALLIEKLSNQRTNGDTDVTYEAQVTRDGDMFFRGTVGYYKIDQDALATIRRQLAHQILDRLAKDRYLYQQVPENDPLIQIHQWENLDIRGVFRLEDGIVDVMNEMIRYGRKRARAKGAQVD